MVGAFIKNAKDNLVAGKLADAAQNVKDALSLAPNFSAAKVLQLTIRKQTDPIGFQKDAASQIQTYLAMANGTNPGRLADCLPRAEGLLAARPEVRGRSCAARSRT